MPGRGYRYFTGTPVFEFGAGLSYTTFTYDWSGTNRRSISALEVPFSTFTREIEIEY